MYEDLDLDELLQKAIANDLPIRIKYWPNKTGERLVGWRYIVALDVFSKDGEEYLFAWWERGSSVSGSSGYRLFFTRNIQDYEVSQREIFRQSINALKLSDGAYKVPTRAEVLAQIPNARHYATMMCLRGQIE